MRKKLQIFRHQHGMTQWEFAEFIGYSHHYERIERGESQPSIKFITALATAFNLSIEEATTLCEPSY